MTATTVKVSAETRDRLNALAAGRGLTAGSMVEELLDSYLWRQQVETAKRQMRAVSPAEAADYAADAQAWDRVAGDGLDEHPW